MVLPSDSSKKYFPGNTCSSFTTQLPHGVHLFGEWEVALSEIQFPSSLFHVRRNDNKIRFADLKSVEDEKNADKFTVKESHLQAGVYENTEDLVYAINKECRRADSHFTFELQKGSGGNVRISIDCDDNCTLVHYINLPANIFQILRIDIGETDVTGIIYRHELPNSNELTPFLKLGYAIGTGRAVSFWTREPCSLWHGIPDKMYVYCDICEPYITGDTRSPLLRIVPLDIPDHNYGRNQVKYFSTLQYTPLRQTKFHKIEIDIKDHRGEKIPFVSGTLIVTLHFRRVR